MSGVSTETTVEVANEERFASGNQIEAVFPREINGRLRAAFRAILRMLGSFQIEMAPADDLEKLRTVLVFGVWRTEEKEDRTIVISPQMGFNSGYFQAKVAPAAVAISIRGNRN